jgi:fermentation-respiration switch protein FrsA (DUF1100 family)
MQKEKIQFQSEGMRVIGNLFKPQNNSKKEIPLPAVLVAGAMTGVKEQVAGHYAERIAKAGYVTLALDHRHFGESEGMPRQHEDPAKKMEDFKNAVSFLSSLNDVDKERIGACGISMGGGYMLQLAAFDRRIKAIAIVASGLNLGDTLLEMLGKDGFINFLKEFNAARQRHYDTGEVQYIPAVATDSKPAAMIGDEPFEYYGTSRAWSPGWANRYTTESIENLMSYNAIPYAHHVSPTPLLVVHGRNDKYCFPKFAQQVYEETGEPKEILWLETTNHIDLYDNEKYVSHAISKIIEWFGRYLVNTSLKKNM